MVAARERIMGVDKIGGSCDAPAGAKNLQIIVAEKDEHKLNQRVPNHYKVLTSLTAGAIAGAVAKTVIAPLDRTKINFQTTKTPFSYVAALRFIVNTYRTDGFVMLWRGNTATMARIVPYASIQYAAHEQWKRLLNPTNQRVLAPLPRFIAGSLAGVTAVSCTYPLDMVRARMAVTERKKYYSLRSVFRKTYREEGIWKLYRGFTPTLLGVVPYSGVSFFTYESLKKFHWEYYKNKDPSALHRLCFGAIAGLLGQTSSYPLDIVRRRMQTAGVFGNESVYTTISGTLLRVASTEGIRRGLYKGLTMNFIKGPVAVGISFMTFDTIQKWLRRVPFFHE
ncbi:mitochondrial coenzyme A transporter SLC25A42-like isoform X2 [Tubulanus polymorphus]|uniref:mitochondrial coenzyme A transporter SLC25A42-like isoform X2 n=1 Tax=Tubulanus polymorphus TaxID=672921 RepID=UPI003DA66944